MAINLSPTGPSKVSALTALIASSGLILLCIADSIVHFGFQNGNSWNWSQAGHQPQKVDTLTAAIDPGGSEYIYYLQNIAGITYVLGALRHARVSASSSWSTWEQLSLGKDFSDVSLSHDENGLIQRYVIDSENNFGYHPK